MSTVQGGQGNIVTNGLILNLDAANPRSYAPPFNGTTWQNLVAVSSSISGSLINGIAYTGSNGGALVFDGTDDYIDCGNSTPLQITGSLTLSTWIKASTSSPHGTLFCKSVQVFGDPGQKIYELGYLSNVMYFQIGDNANNTATLSYTSSPVVTNTWHQVIASWDGTTNTNGLKLYYDGLLVAQTTSTVTSIQNLAYSLILGYGRRSSFLYTGNMAVAQVYNRALNASEVLQNFNATRARFGV